MNEQKDYVVREKRIQIGVSMSPKLLRRLRVLAAQRGQSRNQFMCEVLEQAIITLEAAPPVVDDVRDLEEDPIERFVHVLSDAFAQGVIWVQGMQGIADTEYEPYADNLGFVDQDWLYLFGEATFNYVQKHCRSAGDPFPLNRNALYRGLVDRGIVIAGTQYTTLKLRVGDSSYSVLKVQATRFGVSPRPVD